MDTAVAVNTIQTVDYCLFTKILDVHQIMLDIHHVVVYPPR